MPLICSGASSGMVSLELGYDDGMKPEMQRFNDALRSVLQVSKHDLQRMLEAEKQANADKPKRGPKPKVSGHVASERIRRSFHCQTFQSVL